MADVPRCPSCGLPLNRPGLAGLCPACLLELGMAPGVATGFATVDAAATAAGAETALGSDHGRRERATADVAGAPRTIGPYHIERPLGEGGMGVVYLAEQLEPIQRRVALKVIKLGMDTREVVARFEAERQALALMDHPHIASVLDAGATPDGRPYFVMEYVDGVPITEYCDSHALNTRQRVALFLQVCAAVQHAHQKGIIHRDLKPSNVLVTEVDGQPVPKVIDFGIAKATDQRLTEQTIFTQHGLLIGTPEYVSPEQADPGAQDIDTRTDIYSLGVILYELLAGAAPFDSTRLRQGSFAELQRIIREEEPARPSTKLQSVMTTAHPATGRPTTTRRVVPSELQGDLDWITLKAIEKDRARRNATVSELAADLERYLGNEPIVARPPSAAYRVQKFVRRNRLAVSAAGVVALAVVAGLVVSSVLYVRAERARGEAVAQRSEAVRERAEADTQRAQAEQRRAEADAARDAEAEARAREASQRAVAERRQLEADAQRGRAERQGYAANVTAAEMFFRANDIVSARQRLLLCPTELRRFEWLHTWRKIDPTVATLWLGGRYPGSFGLSPDGSRLLWHTDSIVRAWNTADYAPVGLDGGIGTILAMSGDGTRVVTQNGPLVTPTTVLAEGRTEGFLDRLKAVRPMVVRVVDVRSRKVIAELPDHVTDAREVMELSDGGATVASVTGDGLLRVWDADRGQLQRTLKATGPLVISRDGRRIAAVAEDRRVIVWDVASGAVVYAVAPAGGVQAVALSADATRVAIGLTQPNGAWSIQIADVQTGRTVTTPAGNGGVGMTLRFGADGRRLVAGWKFDRVLRVFDTLTGAVQATLPAPYPRLPFGDPELVAVTFGPDDRWIAAGVYSPSRGSSKVHVWEAPTFGGTFLMRPLGLASPIAVSPDGTRLAAGSAFGTIWTWDAASGKTLATWLGHRERVAEVAFSPDGRRLASCSSDKSGRVSDAMSGDRIAALEGHEAEVSAIAFSPDGRRVVTGSMDRTARVWDAASGRQVLVLRHVGRVRAVAFSPDGSSILTASGNLDKSLGKQAAVTLWDARGGTVRRVFSSGREEQPNHVAFSPDGRRVVAAMLERVCVWDVGTGRLVTSFEATGEGGLAFHPDGTRIAAGALSSDFGIWDAERGERLLASGSTWFGQAAVTFSPDGTRLYCASLGDGIVRVLDTASAHPPEAEALVTSLFDSLVFVNAVVDRLSNAPGLDRRVREAAIRLARMRGDDPRFIAEASWATSKVPGRTAGDYRRAATLAEAAWRLAPWNEQIQGRRAAAQYRTGQFQAALATLTAPDRTQTATDVAFIAMAHQGLGERDRALAALDRLHGMARNAGADLRALIAEVDAMMGTTRK